MNAKSASAVAMGIAGLLVAGSAGIATAHATPDPCTLLTQSEVSTALGVKVDAGKPLGTTGCEWDGPGSQNIKASITVHDATQWQLMKTPLPRMPKVPATGIGDDAFYTTVSTLTTLSVKKGDVTFVIHLMGIQGQSKQESVEKALAKDVIAHL
jgi:hypothetical protein